MHDGRPLVLLVQLPIPPPGPQPVEGNVPLAAAYLKLFARRRGLDEAYRIELLAPALANTLGDQGLVEEVLSRRPWMVGFTCYVWNIERTLWIAERLRQARPDLRILLGGPEITPDNEWVLRRGASFQLPGDRGASSQLANRAGGVSRDWQVENSPHFFAVVGEGEQTFAELLAALHEGKDTGTVAGLWTAAHGLSARRTPLDNLDAVFSPYLDGILDAGRKRTMLLETTRGCRFRCKYCYYAKNYDRLHFLSQPHVEAGLRYANQQGVTEVCLLDPTLNQRPDFAQFLRVLARGNPQRQFTYSAELRAEGIDVSIARLLREANFNEVEIGLQSLDPQTQRLMGRPVDLAAFERGVRAMLDEGIRVRVDLILGLPGDTLESFRRGIDYLAYSRLYSEIQVFNLSVLPGTAFRDEAAQLGLEYQPHPPYYVLKTPTLDVEGFFTLMDEAQEAFGAEFDVPDPPAVGPVSNLPTVFHAAPTAITGATIDLDKAAQPLPPSAARSQAFTLWLRSADFDARRGQATELVGQLLADNPHTTLQIVLEPTMGRRRLSAGTLESLHAACHQSLSYLDWYYSLHPVRLLGAKRLFVRLPWSERACAGQAWIDQAGEFAAIVWRGAPPDVPGLAEHEFLEPQGGWDRAERL
jgi:radical SAM superfamily enzyme YgiQ (UPF0313 family)